jgi:hypothetical protein
MIALVLVGSLYALAKGYINEQEGVAYLDYISKPLIKVELTKMRDALLVGRPDHSMDMGRAIGVVTGEVGVKLNCAKLRRWLPSSKKTSLL